MMNEMQLRNQKFEVINLNNNNQNASLGINFLVEYKPAIHGNTSKKF